MKRSLLHILAILLPVCIWAQETIEASFLTDKIILVEYTDGFVLHPQNGESASSAMTQINPIDIASSQSESSYSITSNDDAAYYASVNPLEVHRKSKPIDFTKQCDSWQYIPYYEVFGCVNEGDHTMLHQLYLILDDAVQDGATYTLNMVNGALAIPYTVDLVYDEQLHISGAIHTNNVAYSTDAPEKFAYVYHWLGDGGALDLSGYSGNTFDIISVASGASVYSGSLTFRKGPDQIETYQFNTGETPNQNFNRAQMYECDFSQFTDPGAYYLSIDGIGRSRSFDISCNAYRGPFESVMKGLFQNRSGQEIDHPFAEVKRPIPHHPELTDGFGGKLKYTSTTTCSVSNADADQSDSLAYTTGILGELDATWGWYQDAGDWDGYLRHTEVPIKLMLTYKAFSENFTDSQLTIPESGNGIPDILDEARWLIRFYKRLKDETEAKGYTTGGVAGHRIFGDLWGDDGGEQDLVRGSWEDNDRTWIVSGEDVPMTYLYAGMAAQLWSVYSEFDFSDPEGIDWQAEAIAAFEWAEDNYQANYDCHGLSLSWQRNYAAAALYSATLESNYESVMQSSYNDADAVDNNSFAGNIAFGAYLYLLEDDYTNTSFHNQLKDKVISTGDYTLLEIGQDRGCRWGGNPYFPMIVGHGTTPYIFEGIMAYTLVKDSDPAKASDYWTSMHNTLDYFLGTNPLGKTWISGYDDTSPYGILHLDSWATGDGSTKEGIVPYGPWRDDGFWNMGWWQPEWANQWVYPAHDVWPGHERWYENRYLPRGGEFTINQNSVNAAAAYGALSGNYDCEAISTSSKELALNPEDSIIIYPNPMTESFRVIGELDKYDLKIVNQMGEVVLYIPNVGSDFHVPVDQLSAGVFYIQIIADNGSVSMKHVIKI